MQDHPFAFFRKTRDPQMTMEALAELLGVTKATISRWESGERFPERELWARIKETTGIGAEELAEWTAPAAESAA